MRIFICDRCGHKATWTRGIVGAEFESQGFVTLKPEYRTNEIVDVCAKCYKSIDALRAKLNAQSQKSLFTQVKEAIANAAAK